MSRFRQGDIVQVISATPWYSVGDIFEIEEILDALDKYDRNVTLAIKKYVRPEGLPTPTPMVPIETIDFILVTALN